MDLSIRAVGPEEVEYEEFFVHSTDWWIAIFEVIQDALGNQFPVDAMFPRVHPILSKGLPLMDRGAAYVLGWQLERVVASGVARAVLLDRYRREGPSLDMSPEEVGDFVDRMIPLVESFADFLLHCGGCYPKGHKP